MLPNNACRLSPLGHRTKFQNSSGNTHNFVCLTYLVSCVGFQEWTHSICVKVEIGQTHQRNKLIRYKLKLNCRITAGKVADESYMLINDSVPKLWVFNFNFQLKLVPMGRLWYDIFVLQVEGLAPNLWLIRIHGWVGLQHFCTPVVFGMAVEESSVSYIDQDRRFCENLSQAIYYK